MERVAQKHLTAKSLIEKTNNLTSELTSEKIIFFKPISILVRYHNPEVCFGDLINWLYALFVEVSTPNLVFFTKKLKINGIETSSEAQSIVFVVHAIRTVTNHNMEEDSDSDQEKINYAESWYQSVIGKKKPETNQDWITCNDKLLDAVNLYLNAIFTCITIVSSGEHFDIVLQEWINLVHRDYGSHDFERILVEALHNNGLDNIFDTTKITRSELGKWKEELKVLKDGFDFHTEAYRIVERFIRAKQLCPITGLDLIKLGVRPGKELGDLLTVALALFNAEPCTKEILLQKMEGYIGK